MSLHCTYTKKLYDETLPIIRVRCCNRSCRKTHALIPSFSTPCCSTGTAELDSFIHNRAGGKTIDQSGQCFCDKGMSPDYPESIHRRLKKRYTLIQTLCAPYISHIEITSGYAPFLCALAKALTGTTDSAATAINCNSTHFGCNPLLFSRINILLLPQNSSKTSSSHDPPFRKSRSMVSSTL